MLIAPLSVRVVGNANSANYTIIYTKIDKYMIMTQKSIRDYINLIEDAQNEDISRRGLLKGLGAAMLGVSVLTKVQGATPEYGKILGPILAKNITFGGYNELESNPVVVIQIKASPKDGNILWRRVIQSSGNKEWDVAVLKGLDKTQRLPKDADGTYPETVLLHSSPRPQTKPNTPEELPESGITPESISKISQITRR